MILKGLQECAGKEEPTKIFATGALLQQRDWRALQLCIFKAGESMELQENADMKWGHRTAAGGWNRARLRRLRHIASVGHYSGMSLSLWHG